VNGLSYVKADSAAENENKNQHVKILIDFKKGLTTDQLDNFLLDHTNTLQLNTYYAEHVDQSAPITYRIGSDTEGDAGIIDLYMIPRHPAQLYESFSCLLLFLLLFWIWRRYKADLPPGRLLGIFLIVCFGLRFAFEFLKENQVAFENELPYNMGQFLSIPLVLIGVVIFALSFRKSKIQNTSQK
jgi:phosphatidylglycerol:prolipoprotein diacylglycerol transferase